MQLDKITLTDAELARIDVNFLTTRPDFTKQATVVFTNGKSDLRWRGSSPASLGVTFAQLNEVDDVKKRCTGTCLIDLFAIMGHSRTPKWVSRGQTIPASLSPALLRFTAVKTVVHELLHISQAWQIGKRFFIDTIQERISATNRATDYAAVNSDMPDDPYLQDMFERGARDFADRWGEAHRSEVHAGKYDFLLPMITLRGMFPDMPGAFR